MTAPGDSDDDSCVPRSRATVEFDLSKHLPPRLSFSQSDGEVKQDSNKPAGNGNGENLQTNERARGAHMAAWYYG